MPTFTAGQTINGAFRVVSVLAKSRTGVLYECQTLEEAPESVAVKVVDPVDGEQSPDAGNLFMDLAVITMLELPHLVRVHEAKEIDFRDPYIAMELLEGEDLAARIRARSGLGPAELLGVLRPVCSVLEQIHGEGLIHGAIKPSNVFLVPGAGEDGGELVKVLDPAIYHVQRTRVEARGPATIGYLPWLAPEQAAGQPDWFGPATDVYLLGLLCYVALSGKQPFSARGQADLVQQIRHEQPRPIGELVPDLPAGLLPVLTRALVKTPGHRYQQVPELLAELEQTLLAAPEAEPEPPPLSPLRPRKRRPAPADAEPAATEDRPGGSRELWDLSDLHLSRLPPPMESAPAPEIRSVTRPPEEDLRQTRALPEEVPRKTVALPEEDTRKTRALPEVDPRKTVALPEEDLRQTRALPDEVPRKTVALPEEVPRKTVALPAEDLRQTRALPGPPPEPSVIVEDQGLGLEPESTEFLSMTQLGQDESPVSDPLHDTVVDSSPPTGGEDLQSTAVDVIRSPGTGEPMEVIVQSDSGQPEEETWDPEATVLDDRPPDRGE